MTMYSKGFNRGYEYARDTAILSILSSKRAADETTTMEDIWGRIMAAKLAEDPVVKLAAALDTVEEKLKNGELAPDEAYAIVEDLLQQKEASFVGDIPQVDAMAAKGIGTAARRFSTYAGETAKKSKSLNWKKILGLAAGTSGSAAGTVALKDWLKRRPKKKTNK